MNVRDIFIRIIRGESLPLLSLVLAAGAILRLYNLTYFHYMTADECVYTQAVFAVTKGCMPYRDVFIAHPLLYFLIQYPFLYFKPSLFMARLPSVLLGLGTTIFVFYTAKALYPNNVAVLAAALFAFSPYTIYYNKLAITDNAALFFTTGLLFFFFKYYRNNNDGYLILSGILAGAAFVSKYSSAFIIAVLMLLIAIKNLKKFMLFAAFTFIIPSIFVLLLLLLDIYYYWFTQTVILQLIRFNLPQLFKIWDACLYFALILPLLLVAIPAMARGVGDDVILTVLYIVPLLLMFFGKTFFSHYPLILTSPLCILTARSLNQYVLKSKRRRLTILTLVIFLTHFCICSSIFMGSAQMENAVRIKMEIADYIKSITKDDDKIWTTEADIAFFAQRIIVPPRSEIWKYQGFYEDVWGYIGASHVGDFSGYSGGLITLNEIRQAIEDEKPKVIVILRHKIADKLIWNGINKPGYREEGLAEYILEHYNLNRSMYDIEIYIRK
ncbi:MAG: glycosyltransferase family 39 protein [Candidatus Bathyarchaeia archaeon]